MYIIVAVFQFPFHLTSAGVTKQSNAVTSNGVTRKRVTNGIKIQEVKKK